MPKQKKRKHKIPPFYVAYRLQSVEDLETKLNELRNDGFMITQIMCGLETYTVVALKPDL